MSRTVTVHAPDGAPEIAPGADLAALVVSLLTPRDGDIVAVTSKAVAKAEGRVVAGDRDAVITRESVRVVARTGPTRIVRTRHGLTMAAAGVDASNVASGSVVALPVDPDASARSLRERVTELSRVGVGVVVTDTAGRAWRLGQTDIAIGAAGLRVLDSFAGRKDAYGNPLLVTAPAIADEIAGAAELAQGKLSGRPFAVIRGLADLVLPSGDHGPGAAALIRPESADLFGFGAREAVVRALGADPADRSAFGAPASAEELVEALARVGIGAVALVEPGRLRCARSQAGDRVRAVAFAHGWVIAGGDSGSCELTPAGATARDGDPNP